MSSPQRRLSPLPVRERAACMCSSGETCSSFAPGHALHLVQSRLAAATPLEWVDAIVASSDAASGIVLVRTLAEDDEIEIWSGHATVRAAAAGTPVALHRRYHVLALEGQRFNVLRS